MNTDLEKVDYTEAAELLGVKIKTIWNLVSKKRLNPERPRGRRPYFTREYINKIIKEGYEEPP